MSTASTSIRPRRSLPAVRVRSGGRGTTAPPSGPAWVPFAVGTAAMLTIGGYRLTGAPLHWDEGATLSAAQRSVPEILRLMSHVDAVLGPYYLFMKPWIGLFGQSDLALRLPSLIATSLGVGVVGEIGRRLVGQWAGIVAALLCAMLPILSFHGIQARPYGFVFLLAGLSTLTLLRSLIHPAWGNWIRYGVVTELVGAFHLIGLSLVAGHLSILAGRWYRQHDRAVLRGGVVVGAVVALMSPLILLGARERDAQLNWVQRPTLHTLATVPGDLVMSPVIGYALLGLALSAGFVLAGRTYRELLALLALPAVAVLAGSVVAAPIWVPRYVMFVVGPMCILAAAALTAGKVLPLAGRAAAAVAVLAGVAVFALPFQQSIRVTQGAADTRSMATIMAAAVQPGDTLVFGDYTLRPLVYHYLGETTLAAARTPRDVLLVRTAAEIGQLNVIECAEPARCLAGVSRVWLVTSDQANGDAPLANPTVKMQTLRAGFTTMQTWQLGAGALTLLAAHPTAPAGG